MGTIRFVLRTDKPDKDGCSPIQLIYQLSGIRKYYKTGEKLRSENWNPENQQAIYLDKRTAKNLLPKVVYNLLPSSKEIEEINGNLLSIKKEVSDIESRFKLNKVIYSAEMVIESLRENKAPLIKKNEQTNLVFDFIDKYIQDNKASREPASMCVYKSLKSHLQSFQINKRKKVTFDNIDYSFFLEFQNYLINTKSKRTPNGLGNVTIAKQLSTLKTFLNYARMQGIEVSDKYKDFKIKKESLEVIALTNEEFETLYNFDLSGNKKLDHVRDVFCFSCATGFRYSDLSQLKREHIKAGEIKLTVTKTKQKLTVPLNPYSHAILEKYSAIHRPLPVISNQKMNEYIKELCKKAEINEPVQIVRFHGAKREEKTYPKYELIRVHTGRKTFATLSLEKGMSAEEVMKIGGWKSYSSFARYVNITEKRTKVVMSKAWGIIPKLKAV
jgi:integrase